MAVKGVLHPADAEEAVALGIDGIWVSNHGGRQIDALTPSIDCLPAIASAVGKKATIILDSGVRSARTSCARSRSAPTRSWPASPSSGRWRRSATRGRASHRPLYRRVARVPRPDRRPDVADARKATIHHPGAINFGTAKRAPTKRAKR